MIKIEADLGISNDVLLSNDILRYENASLQREIAQKSSVLKKLEAERGELLKKLSEMQDVLDRYALAREG